MSAQELTPAQTVGPFYGFALPYAEDSVVVRGGDVRIRGGLYDGAGEPVPDGLIEVLQADTAGNLTPGGDGSDVRCFGRCSTRPGGMFAFTTMKPGPTDDGCAPHLAVIVHARGLLRHLHTRMYFPDEAEANEADPVLAAVPADRRGTLVATAERGGYRFDIRLQGGAETVFFDV